MGKVPSLAMGSKSKEYCWAFLRMCWVWPVGAGRAAPPHCGQVEGRGCRVGSPPPSALAPWPLCSSDSWPLSSRPCAQNPSPLKGSPVPLQAQLRPHAAP